MIFLKSIPSFYNAWASLFQFFGVIYIEGQIIGIKTDLRKAHPNQFFSEQVRRHKLFI